MGFVLDEAFEVGASDPEAAAGLVGEDGGGGGSSVEAGHLAEVAAGSEAGELGVFAEDEDLAFEEDAEAAAGVALVDEDVAFGVGGLGAEVEDAGEVLHGEAVEDGDGLDGVEALFDALDACHDAGVGLVEGGSDEEGGDVVAAAAEVGLVDEGGDDFGVGEVGVEAFEELIVALEVLGEAVGAEEELVAVHDVDDEGVDLDAAVLAE